MATVENQTAITLGDLPSPPAVEAALKKRHRLTEHRAPIGRIALNPGGQRLASWSPGELLIWNAESGQLLQRLDGLEGPVDALVWHGYSLAIGSRTGLKFWHEKKPLELIESHQVQVSQIAYHPREPQLAVLTAQGRVLQLFDLATGERAWSIPLSERGMGLLFHPHGQRLAVLGESGDLLLVDTMTGTPVLHLPAAQDPVLATAEAVGLAFSPDGLHLAAGNGHGGWTLWSAPLDPDAERPVWRKAAQGRAFAWHVQRWQASRSYPYCANFHLRQLQSLEFPTPWYRQRYAGELKK